MKTHFCTFHFQWRTFLISQSCWLLNSICMFCIMKMMKLNCMANCGILTPFLTIFHVEGDEQSSPCNNTSIKVHNAHVTLKCALRIDLHATFPYWSSSGGYQHKHVRIRRIQIRSCHERNAYESYGMMYGDWTVRSVQYVYVICYVFCRQIESIDKTWEYTQSVFIRKKNWIASTCFHSFIKQNGR